MMGVYGMLAIGFFMFVARYFIPPDRNSERAMRLSFLELNLGPAAGCSLSTLCRSESLQLYDSFHNGYWHARQADFFQQPAVRMIEWLRLPGDAIFILCGILPVVYLAVRMFLHRRRYQQLHRRHRRRRFHPGLRDA